ncbi:MAG: TetR/AcrR family transcriptional regulator [Planctomycetes bacterium]|nr:TetR/AcrR family transcriptional regulator [Planctomycetota bacterium]
MRSAAKRKLGRPTDPGLRQRRQEEILDAAAGIFAQHGFPKTDLQLVADALQLAKGTLYRYFPSKEALFLAVVDRGMRRLHAAVEADCAGVEDPLERIAQAIRTYLAFYKDHPEFAELLIQERAEFKNRKKPTYFVHRDASLGPWRELFHRLIAEGRVRNLPVERILNVMSDLVYGTMFTNYFTGRDQDPEEQAREVLEVVFHGILSDRERSRRP